MCLAFPNIANIIPLPDPVILQPRSGVVGTGLCVIRLPDGNMCPSFFGFVP